MVCMLSMRLLDCRSPQLVNLGYAIYLLYFGPATVASAKNRQHLALGFVHVKLFILCHSFQSMFRSKNHTRFRLWNVKCRVCGPLLAVGLSLSRRLARSPTLTPRVVLVEKWLSEIDVWQ